jgi:hypothetical protein
MAKLLVRRSSAIVGPLALSFALKTNVLCVQLKCCRLLHLSLFIQRHFIGLSRHLGAFGVDGITEIGVSFFPCPFSLIWEWETNVLVFVGMKGECYGLYGLFLHILASVCIRQGTDNVLQDFLLSVI